MGQKTAVLITVSATLAWGVVANLLFGSVGAVLTAVLGAVACLWVWKSFRPTSPPDANSRGPRVIGGDEAESILRDFRKGKGI